MWEIFFFQELFYFVTGFFTKAISENIKGSPTTFVWGCKPPKPPKTAKSPKRTKKGSEHASLNILKALILIIFSHFFSKLVLCTPSLKNHFFAKRFFPWIFSLTHLSNEPKWLVRLADFKFFWYLEQSVVSLISKYIRVAESYYCNCCGQ